MLTKSLGWLAVIATAGLATTLLMSFRTQQGTSATAQPEAHPDRAFHGSSITQISDQVSGDFAISLLPKVALSNGQIVRPLSTRMLFEIQGGRSIGESSVHKLIPAASNEVVDLSSSDLDLNLHDPSKPSSYKRFTVRVTPAPGRTWGDVKDFKDDLIVATNAP